MLKTRCEESHRVFDIKNYTMQKWTKRAAKSAEKRHCSSLPLIQEKIERSVPASMEAVWHRTDNPPHPLRAEARIRLAESFERRGIKENNSIVPVAAVPQSPGREASGRVRT